MLAASERAQFEVRDVESLREHYAKTLKQWVKRLEAHRADAIREIGERSYRVWRLYMAGSAHEFFRGHLSIYQTLLAKLDDAGSVLVAPSRHQWYVERPLNKETVQ
jgi:cyclopropane-fatty-acyl-phospholipid synthase